MANKLAAIKAYYPQIILGKTIPGGPNNRLIKGYIQRRLIML